MDPLSVILGALVAGASEATKAVASDLIKTSYSALKAKLAAIYDSKALPLVESEPGEDSYRKALSKELTNKQAADHSDLVEQSRQFLDTLAQQQQNLSQPAQVIIRNFKAGALNIGAIRAGDNGCVGLQDFDIQGKADIGEISAGKQPG